MHKEHGEGGPHEGDDAASSELPEQAQSMCVSTAKVPGTAGPTAETAPAHDRDDAESSTIEADQLAELKGAVRSLTLEAREYHTRAAAREQVIDNLHAEVERLRAGEQNLLLRPIVTDLQNLRKDLLREAGALPAELSSDRAAELLKSFALSVELALERCGSVAIQAAVGDEFSSREHRAVKLIPTARAEQDGTVAAVAADGYREAETDRVTAPARVHVYRWQPTESDGKAQEQEQTDA